MELLLLLLIAAVIGYIIGRSRRSKNTQPASQQIVDAEARDTSSVE